MNIYEHNSNKQFNRGKLLRSVVFAGTPSRIGYVGKIVVHAHIYISEGQVDRQLKPSDLGVKAFMFSQSIQQFQAPNTWETTYVGNVPGLKLDIPTCNGGKPMTSKKELQSLGIETALI